MVKVAIADDHPMVVEGICNMLQAYEDIRVLQQYHTGAALIEGLQQQVPDLLLLDIHLGKINSTDLLPMLKQQYPRLKILIVSAMDNPFLIKDILKKGVHGYVTKSIQPELLKQAIEQVYAGKTYIEPAVRERLLESVMPDTTRKIDARLTKREVEILQLICDGNNNYDIAEKLFLSHRTVENHRLSIYYKLDVKNVAELVKKAIFENII
jgi:DNA-binding NarL/FixJ family response regulator